MARLLLYLGLWVVLDFPGNTRRQCAWFRQLIDLSGVDHELHFVDASDAMCTRQLRARSERLPEGTAWTGDADFDAVTTYFEPSVPEG